MPGPLGDLKTHCNCSPGDSAKERDRESLTMLTRRKPGPKGGELKYALEGVGKRRRKIFSRHSQYRLARMNKTTMDN